MVPVRRVDQMMYELVGQARSEILLVSYVTYGADEAIRNLRAASERGVKVSLVVESSAESDGKLPFRIARELAGLSGGRLCLPD